MELGQSICSTACAVDAFITEWEKAYRSEIAQISLFNPELTQKWTIKQRQRFVKIFYHVRGHFHDFLWYMGNHAPDADTKKIVLSNIAEEFSINGLSHEQLYHDFANALNVPIEEVIQKDCYLPFVREFNNNHMTWLVTHDWVGCFSAFSAYEKLDNVDYHYLYHLAESFDLARKALTFFSVHLHVEHFDVTLQKLIAMWDKNPTIVREAFDFIASNQLEMWKKLNNEMANFME